MGESLGDGAETIVVLGIDVGANLDELVDQFLVAVHTSDEEKRLTIVVDVGDARVLDVVLALGRQEVGSVVPVPGRAAGLQGVVLAFVAHGGPGGLVGEHGERNGELGGVVGLDEDFDLVAFGCLSEVGHVEHAGALGAGELFVEGRVLEVDGVVLDGALIGRGRVEGDLGLGAHLGELGSDVAGREGRLVVVGFLELDGGSGGEGEGGNS